MFFEYSEDEVIYLKSRDKLLGDAIDRIGHIYRETDDDLFSSVIHQIIGQQISTAAQETVWSRLREKVSVVNADSILLIPDDELQSIGVSFRKVSYIKAFAEKVQSGELDLDTLNAKTDQEVIRELSSLKGIGVWTAEMLLIFCLQRPDVLSFNDLGIQRGMRMLYHHRNISRELFEKHARRYSPCGSVASLYLWAISGGAIPGLTDPAPVKKSGVKR